MQDISGINSLEYLDGKNILIVEDDVSNYELLRAILRKSGAQFSWARSGVEAVQLFNSKVFDLILMDIKLPGMNGFEAVNKIRERDKKIPIIAQTAYARRDDETQILESGFNGYISKPIDKNKLLQLLETYLSSDIN